MVWVPACAGAGGFGHSFLYSSVSTKFITVIGMSANRLFLGVGNSATGRAWRDRLDERAAARALAIAQRHDLPELLARILAGRNVEIDAVETFLDPPIKRSMPD